MPFDTVFPSVQPVSQRSMQWYQTLLRPLLFRFDPERVHHATVEACCLTGWITPLRALAKWRLDYISDRLQTNVAGLGFNNPVGLAAGWDKSGRAIRMLDHLGFGFIEIGSISARPSVGNPRPRLFRLPEDAAIVVNYGLPNDGAEVVAQRLVKYRSQVPLGVNLVKTNDGPGAPAASEDEILEDYVRSFALLHHRADYVALNLSCPNAAGGKDFFREPGQVGRLLTRLAEEQPAAPVFLKVAPDPSPAAMDDLLTQVDPFPFVSGFLFNLPVGKPTTLTAPRSSWEHLPGAVSGKPVQQLANDCIREMYRRMPRGRYAIIGGGGLFSAEDAYAKIRLGASLVQIYTALVYEGPGVTRRINAGLDRLLERDGLRHISEAVGVDNPSGR
ncbi:MAG: quinone-dependent dihydroorotate dehydrogenase [Planctomycetaceae bacterium]|nr:quinone-dependent dihydroorotate dehydrogenase [Planctomycetaceae bacterium]